MVYSSLYRTFFCVRDENKGLIFSWKIHFPWQTNFLPRSVIWKAGWPLFSMWKRTLTRFHLGKAGATRTLNVSQITNLYVQKWQYPSWFPGHLCFGSHAVTGNNISKHVCEKTSILLRRGISSIQIFWTMPNPQHAGIWEMHLGRIETRKKGSNFHHLRVDTVCVWPRKCLLYLNPCLCPSNWKYKKSMYVFQGLNILKIWKFV